MRRLFALFIIAMIVSITSDFLTKEKITDNPAIRIAALPTKVIAEKLKTDITDIREIIPEKENTHRYIYNIDKIIIHHDKIMSDKHAEAVTIIANYHLSKWNSMAYHYYISRSGDIYYLNDVSRITPHCKGQNQTGIGVCLHGNLNKEKPTESQYEALNDLINQLRDTYRIQGTYLHSDFMNTDCPGENFSKKKIIKKQSTKLWVEKLIRRTKHFLSPSITGKILKKITGK